MIYQALVKPLKTSYANFMELSNEVFMILVCYNFFILTDWIPEKERQYDLAWNFIYIVSAMIIYNASPVAGGLFKSFRLNVIK